MKSTAQPIADTVHEQFSKLADQVAPESAEQAALAVIAGAGRWLMEQSVSSPAVLRARILTAIASQCDDSAVQVFRPTIN